ncbi:MAG: cytochrome c oxidase subunit II [Anaerolineae bacterium]|nr:cytochrome c oxidase subunit II [Anaerolineae bacterium]
MSDFPLFPEQASTVAWQVDLIYFTLVALSVFFSVAVAAAIVFFALRYRKGADVDRSHPLTENTKLELTWSIIPFIMAMGVFGWAATVFVNIKTPPVDAMEVYVIGKQWMWHAQHPSGKSEINQLHIPVNTPVKLIMTSQDVIHDFFIPAFRVKQDVVPGRYTTLWFEATKTGEYHLFCAEYCGTEHSAMVGSVVVLEQAEYKTWLGGGGASEEPLAVAGERLFTENGCISCHSGQTGAIGPPIATTSLFGAEREFADGSTGTVDEAYIRESILNPQAKVVSGYPPVMPSYDGQLSEQSLLQLIEYIKSK